MQQSRNFDFASNRNMDEAVKSTVGDNTHFQLPGDLTRTVDEQSTFSYASHCGLSELLTGGIAA